MSYDAERELDALAARIERMPDEFAAYGVKVIQDGAAAEAAKEQARMTDYEDDDLDLDDDTDTDEDTPPDLDEEPPPSREAVALERLRRRMSSEAELDAAAYELLPGEAPPTDDRTARALQTATDWFQRQRAEASDEVLDAADELDDADGLPLYD